MCVSLQIWIKQHKYAYYHLSYYAENYFVTNCPVFFSSSFVISLSN